MAYVTLSELKNYLKIPEEDTQHDAVLTTLNEAASSQIEKYCGRVFTTQTDVVDYFDLQQEDIVVLNQYPVESIIAITLEGQELTDYRLTSETGVIEFYEPLTGELKVKYNVSEFAPYLVRMVNLQLASHFFNLRQREGISTEKIGSYSFSMLEDAAKKILSTLDYVKKIDD